jgi:hypothetical protein
MQTSFIPKKVYQKTRSSKRDFGGLFMGIGVVIFIVTILSAGAVFLYNRYLTDGIETMAESLERQKGNLEKDIIEELNMIDKKIEASKTILNEHLTLVPFFELLEKNTLQKVRFEEMTFNPVDGEWVLDLSGTADSYATIALQSDIFNEDKNMSEVIFSDLGVGSDGGVVFKVSAKIDTRLLSYRKSLE